MREDGLLHTAGITEGKVSTEKENYQTAKEFGKLSCHDGSVVHLTCFTYYIFVKTKSYFQRPLDSFHLPFHNETCPVESWNATFLLFLLQNIVYIGRNTGGQVFSIGLKASAGTAESWQDFQEYIAVLLGLSESYLGYSKQPSHGRTDQT